MALGLAALAIGLAQSPASAAVPTENVIQAAPPGNPIEALLFYVIAAAAVVSALGVCLSKNVVRMAVWLFGALASVSLMYFLLASNFLGAIQLIVYVGGTLILLVFGVMLTNKSPWVRFEPRAIEIAAAAGVCIGLCAALCLMFSRTDWAGTQQAVPGTPVAEFGRQLVTTYLVPFEVAGVLLMIVMVGAAHLARQDQ